MGILKKDFLYRGYRINTGNEGVHFCNTVTLDQVINLMEYMTQKHSKVLCVRLDITNDLEGRSPVGCCHVTRIMENLMRQLESKYRDGKNRVDLKYVWTTEQEHGAPHPHYHLFILVNGNAMQNGYTVMRVINRYVMRLQQTAKEGLVNFSKSNGKMGIMINRNAPDFEQRKEDAIYAGSYLAKTRTKECRPKGARFSSASRLPRC